MVIVTSPNIQEDFEHPAVFLGGAITDAPYWQDQAIQRLTSFSTCFNPRRQEGFVTPDYPNYLQTYQEQVQWEHKHLLAAEVVLFWMPKEALSITTRFELGWWFGMNFQLRQKTNSPKLFVVGIEPDVKGETYLRITLPQIGIPVHSTLEDTCAQACKFLKNKNFKTTQIFYMYCLEPRCGANHLQKVASAFQARSAGGAVPLGQSGTAPPDR